MKQILFLIVVLVCATSGRSQQRPIDKDFLDAVQRKNVPRINLLLRQGANVNAQDHINGYFALQYAINWPDAALVKLLLDKGANVNLTDQLGTTALIEATRGHGPEYVAIVKLLIARGADVHADNDAAIFGAVKEASPEVVRLLLSKGAPVNARDKERDGDTVLMEAASGNSVETLEMLINAGADVKATNDKGQSALMKAVALDHRYSPNVRLPMIELLIRKGADINARDQNGLTPLLHSVVQYMSEAGGIISHPEVVKLLLDNGADVRATDAKGSNALITTVGTWQGPIEIVRLLLEKGIDTNAQNNKGTTALMVASERGKIDVVSLLFAKGADLNLVDSEGSTALDYAVANGQKEIAKMLFARSPKSKDGFATEAEMLAASNNFALLAAATRNNLNQVKELLLMGTDINTRNLSQETPLMVAIEYSYGRNDVVNYLIEKGADVNAVDVRGNTALMIAAERNNSEAATILLAHKAAVNILNKERQSVLHIAAAGLHAKIVQVLISMKPEVGASSAGVDLIGVDVNGRDANGRTPLMLAADTETFVPDEVMELLLGKGAGIDEQDPQGNTPLMIAAKAGSMSGIEFLLSKGAAVNLKNSTGETALRIARRIHENQKIYNAASVEERVVAMLIKAGAKW